MLENKVFCSIRDNLLHPAAMEALADAMMEVQKTDSQKPDLEREALERELRDVQRRSKNIMDAIETSSANPQLIARLDDLTFQLSTMERGQPLTFTRDQFLYLLKNFCAQPTEPQDDYMHRLLNTFVTRIEITDSELLIYFNISENTENKNKNAPQQNFTKESSTEMRLVQQSRTNPNFFLLPHRRSKCPQNGRFGCHPCS